MSAVDVDWLGKKLPETDCNQITRHLNKVFAELTSSKQELALNALDGVVRVNIEIKIVGDKEITKLNKTYFGTNSTTDILSFNADKTATGIDGSLVISIQQAQRQAKQAGISLPNELKALSTHGMLHLLGYNHR